MPAMMTEQQLLAMREQILEDRAALPALLDAPEEGELRAALEAEFDAELSLIGFALEHVLFEEPGHSPQTR